MVCDARSVTQAPENRVMSLARDMIFDIELTPERLFEKGFKKLILRGLSPRKINFLKRFWEREWNPRF
jgi:hypothetical protein